MTSVLSRRATPSARITSSTRRTGTELLLRNTTGYSTHVSRIFFTPAGHAGVSSSGGAPVRPWSANAGLDTPPSPGVASTITFVRGTVSVSTTVADATARTALGSRDWHATNATSSAPWRMDMSAATPQSDPWRHDRAIVS